MNKYIIFALICAFALFGLLGCGVSEAKKPTSSVNSNSSTEIATNPVSTTQQKLANPAETPKKPSAEDIKNGSVKSDDYDENMAIDKYRCSVEAYVVDKDPKGLNIRETIEPNSAIIGKIPFNEDGTSVQIIRTNFSGRVLINRAETTEGAVVFDKEGWVAANLLATSTAGYNTKGVKLYEAGKGTKVLTIIPPETEVRIVSCDKGWVRVKYKSFTGWLDPDSQCGNPVTNCS